MANTVIGSIVNIGAIQNLTSKNGNSFTKRDIVISVKRYDPNTGQPVNDWENTPQLTFLGDKCRDLDGFKVGDMVSISFDLNGRRYTNAQGQVSIITEARPFKIEHYGSRQPQTSQPVQQPQFQPHAYQQQPQMPNVGQLQQSSAPAPGYDVPF